MQAKNPMHNDEFTWDELLCWDFFLLLDFRDGPLC
jgi:hypothetical protein